MVLNGYVIVIGRERVKGEKEREGGREGGREGERERERERRGETNRWYEVWERESKELKGVQIS